MGLNDLLSELEGRLKRWETTIQEIKGVLKYLKHYGYIHALENITIMDVYRAVKKFQEMAGLIQDGEIGPKTIRATQVPRCGVPDFCARDGKLLTLDALSAKWGRTNLTFFIEARDSDLPSEVWDEIITKAFYQWTEVANLKFAQTRAKGNANFVISVGTGRRHGFDGPSGTLAWAQLPPSDNYSGQLLSRFDTAETWTATNSGRGIVLLNVACHEIGHLLGLGHSSVNSALMAPFYSPNVAKPQVRDDVIRMQRLYGPPTNDPNPNPPPNPPPNPVDIPKPTNLTASKRDKTSVLLRWEDNSTGEDAFEVYRNNELQGEVGRGRTSAIDTDVPNGLHKYKIRARKDGKVSGWSNTATIKMGEDPVPPPTPTPEETVIHIEGHINNISIPGYRVTKIE